MTGQPMGEIVVEIDLENDRDRALFEDGHRQASEVRSARIQAVVDTGAVMLALPEDVVDRLGLQQVDAISATLADGSRCEMPVVERVSVRIGERRMLTDAVVIPTGADPLVGQLVMERLDLIADCNNQTLHARPESPDRPLLRL